jgi:hypothetical protein
MSNAELRYTNERVYSTFNEEGVVAAALLSVGKTSTRFAMTQQDLFRGDYLNLLATSQSVRAYYRGELSDKALLNGLRKELPLILNGVRLPIDVSKEVLGLYLREHKDEVLSAKALSAEFKSVASRTEHGLYQVQGKLNYVH